MIWRASNRATNRASNKQKDGGDVKMDYLVGQESERMYGEKIKIHHQRRGLKNYIAGTMKRNIFRAKGHGSTQRFLTTACSKTHPERHR